MNIILFEEHEIGTPLGARDPRTFHLRRVLGKKPGDVFDAGVIGGNRGTGVIERFNDDRSLSYTLRLFDPPLPRVPLRIAVGFVRPVQLRRILRDMANLGIAALDLMGTELGEKSYQETTLFSGGGARAALLEGASQARDTRIPRLTRYPSVRSWLEARPWHEGAGRAALDNVRPQGSFALSFPFTPFSAGSRTGAGEKLAVALGSERGWSDTERAALEEAGFRRLSLGSRALRTESACMAAAVVAMEKIGELA
ncbi:MAG: 16S rRNA (uracil(1498)-N(3))-methyltransferase [Spirochaetaceae bacterium]|jgi:RsmE family RNA methyltransferase|nr:16S rRNA (uracil(1498)-N(3))-methyltransferase [Spirochaetaceae bacterium]